MAKSSINTPYYGLLSHFADIADKTGAINLSNNYSDFPCDPELLNSLVKHLSEGRNKYAPSEGVLELREIIAQRYNNEFGANYDPEQEVTITAGAIQAINTAISSIITEGDEVIIFEPAFETYLPSIEARGARAIFLYLDPTDYSIDWSALTRLITSKTKLIIINSPHNPSGLVLNDESLEQLQRLLNGTKITILSDEAFADMVFDGKSMFSIARYPKLAEKSIIVGSLGKALSVPGWKIGYCLAPAKLTEAFRHVHQYQIFSVNLPIQLALADFLKKKPYWSPLRDSFQHRRDLFASLMKDSRFTLFPVEGGYFQILGYEEISQEPDIDFCHWLANNAGVTAFPLSHFYHDAFDNQRLRICFGKSEEDLKIAAERLSKL
ncbi:MAG TPA: methionine aminotransferase [Perlabentimonas sp.]|jgi:methionine aminotransferase|nr:methionine aminotransferase [Bacteroidales bacterium]MDD4671359.1 methionine aminotransferase [Bacteroidales bacterium]MDY0348580.1 methionine aminotransferase [Tenuifilaceae bacterium]HZJ73454.1 methionine aminotransferase [Perlabentimonas sp.]